MQLIQFKDNIEDRGLKHSAVVTNSNQNGTLVNKAKLPLDDTGELPNSILVGETFALAVFSQNERARTLL